MGGGAALAHCEVYEWSYKVARRLDLEIDMFFIELEELGFDEVFTFSPNPRFCEYMGGDRIGEVTYKDINYGVYRWDLKSQLLD